MSNATSETLTLDRLLKFLNGEAPVSGRWFGEKYEGEPAFWWRPELKRLIETEIQERVKEARLADFTRMKNYYNRGNLKVWDEPDNNHNSVYLDDIIAELTKEGGES